MRQAGGIELLLQPDLCLSGSGPIPLVIKAEHGAVAVGRREARRSLRGWRVSTIGERADTQAHQHQCNNPLRFIPPNGCNRGCSPCAGRRWAEGQHGRADPDRKGQSGAVAAAHWNAYLLTVVRDDDDVAAKRFDSHLTCCEAQRQMPRGNAGVAEEQIHIASAANRINRVFKRQAYPSVQAVGDAQQWNGCDACRRIRQRCQGNLGGHTVLPGSSAQARGESDAEKV